MLGSISVLLHSTPVTVARDLALFSAALVWLGSAFWTHQDAERRIDDGLLVSTATLLGLVPVGGPLVYLLFRPPETLEEVRGRRIELRALETRLGRREPRCPGCRTAVEASFLICPVCTTRLKEPCRACEAPLERLWQACPYCAAPVVKAPPALDLEAVLVAKTARGGRPRRAAAS